jgi:hypothetical protein
MCGLFRHLFTFPDRMARLHRRAAASSRQDPDRRLLGLPTGITVVLYWPLFTRTKDHHFVSLIDMRSTSCNLRQVG